MVAHELKLKQHIVSEEQVSGALQVWRIIHCHNTLILKLEEWIPSGSTQQFQGLDIVCTHVTDSGNNMQSSILSCTRTPFKNFTKRLALVLPQFKQ
jgi:hypothetical protein